MNTTKTVLIALMGILIILSAGCINTEPVDTKTEVRYVYVESESEIQYETKYVAPTLKTTPQSTPKSAPKYTKIWTMVAVNLYGYDNSGEFLGSESFSNEMTVPYTEYDWTGDVPIEDVVDAWGVQYNSVETVSEKSSYPADDKYVLQGQYVIHGDNGIIIMSMTASASRY